jgi:hypothetical protein
VEDIASNYQALPNDGRLSGDGVKLGYLQY